MQQGWDAVDDLRCPLEALPQLVQNYDGRNHAQVFSSVADYFSIRWGSRSEKLQQVPVLSPDTAETITPNSLVRLRGMVVDMFNPEFFLGAYKPSADGPWKPAALYTDSVPEDVATGAETRIMERRPLLLSPVPHEQSWATAAWAGHPVEPPTPSATDRCKRAREPNSQGGHTALRGSTPASDKSDDTAAVKAPRRATSADVDVPYMEADAHPSSITHDQDQTVRQPQGQQQQTAADDEHQQQRPTFLPGDCIVQVYSDFDAFQLHDVVEVLGVMSVVPELAVLQQRGGRHNADHHHGDNDAMAADDAAAADGMDVDDGFWQQEVAALPPTSQVMRVHAFVLRKLPAYTASATSSSSSTAPAGPQAAALATVPRSMPGHLAAQLPLLRQLAVNLLATPLAGDMLAAEYLLLTALGSVVNREDMGGAMGLLPINLTNVPSSSSSSKASQLVPGLAAALCTLLPQVALLPLTVPTLNHKRWYPQQCAATGRLFRGALQLTSGTLLLLDETGMGAGQLGDAGVKNLQALRQVLLKQQLPCTCQVYTHNLNVNQPAVVLSDGRSVLRDSLALTLPLQPQRPVLVKPGQTSVGLSAAGDTEVECTCSPLVDSAQVKPEPFVATAAVAVVDWSAADVAGPESIHAATLEMHEVAAVRDYIAAARRLECRMEQSAAEACVARFRALQQANPGVGMEDLNTIITLSKLMSISLGQEEFSIGSWERAMRMEQLRKQRLAAPAPQQH